MKSKRVTNGSGTVVSAIELDPWGGNTNRSSNDAFQPRKFTTYTRDGNGSDEAMFRRYNRWWSRFDQPDPYDGSYDPTNPQSFNRYAYTQNDPVNFVDPTGLYTNCGQAGLPPCEEEAPPRDPSEDLPRRPDDIPIILPVLPHADRPGGGPVQPTKPRRKLDPSSQECQDLARKIGNILRDIQKGSQAILDDYLNLPLNDPGPRRKSIEGHRKIIKDFVDNLERRQQEYNDKCGGGPGGPGGAPASQPAGNPAASPNPRFVPVPPIIFPVPAPRPVTPSAPGFVPLPVIIIRCVVFRDCGQGGMTQT